MLEALGRAGDTDGNGMISVGELADYVGRRLPELTAATRCRRSRPASPAISSPAGCEGERDMRTLADHGGGIFLALARFCRGVRRPGPDRGVAMNWPEATELLRREKQSGEVCARVIKRFLPPGRWRPERAELEYTEASAAFNAVITGLQIALTRSRKA